MEKYRDTLTNFSEDTIMWDEKKKRFVYLDTASVADVRLFSRNFFRNARPDLFGTDQNEFKIHLRMGNVLIRSMIYQAEIEARRAYRQMGLVSTQFIYPFMEDTFGLSAIDSPRTSR